MGTGWEQKTWTKSSIVVVCTEIVSTFHRKSIKNNKVYVFYDVSIIYISKDSLGLEVLLAKIYKFLDQLLMVSFFIEATL